MLSLAGVTKTWRPRSHAARRKVQESAKPGQGGRGCLGRQRKEKVEENSRLVTMMSVMGGKEISLIRTKGPGLALRGLER